MDSRRETAAYMAILALKNRTTTKKNNKNKRKPVTEILCCGTSLLLAHLPYTQ